MGNYKTKPPSGSRLNRANAFSRDVVLFYLINEGAGSKLADISGKGNEGTLISMHPPTDWIGSSDGWALDFDGSNDYVDTPYFPDPRIPTTLSFWVNFNNTTIQQLIGAHDLSGHRYYIGIDQNNNFYVGIGDSWIGNGTGDVASGIVAGQWTFYTVAIDGSTASMYINGSFRTSFGYSSAAASSDAFWLGARSLGGGDRHVNGKIRYAIINERLLSAEEIKRLYHNSYEMIVRTDAVDLFVPAVSFIPYPQYNAMNGGIGVMSGGIAP
jgi:hypothetical protein